MADDLAATNPAKRARGSPDNVSQGTQPGDVPARGTRGPDEPEGDGAAGSASPSCTRPWSELWQVPTILLSLILIALGLVVGMNRGEEDDFEGALVHVEQLLSDGRLEEAGRGLSQVLEPNLDLASTPEKARFHACVADWIALAQEAENVDREENNRRIHEQYQRAADLALRLSPERIERWGHAQVSLGMIEEARRRLADLTALEADEDRPGRTRRVRLFRRIIDRLLAQPEIDDRLVMEMLRDYRAEFSTQTDVDLDRRIAEQVWAASRQAELRIATGRAQEAIDHLLMDMRRVEHDAGQGPVDVSEMYAILGRAYFDLGQFASARLNLDRALAESQPAAAAGGVAHVLLGRLAASEGDLASAFDHFDTALREYSGPQVTPAALLGRAEVQSALGEHEASREDYRHLVQRLRQVGGRSDLTPERVAASLVDRHDAALARGDLQIALSYIKIAETLFDRPQVPTDVLFRVATTSRQLADDLITAVENEQGPGREEETRQRYRANLLYRDAGEYFARHARALVAIPGRDQDWALSLWNAGDSFDLGGYHELAIEHFQEYLAGRSQQDPRRSDVTFRLARCYHALMDYQHAAEYYERVIAEHPRSTMATQSYVPLAQCYIALGRRPDAEQQLNAVLAGLLPIQPTAVDYRNALLEMANIHYGQSSYEQAIARYHEAAERYPDDPRRLEILFRLADSHRGLAMKLAQRLLPPSPESPGERRRIDDRRREHLQQALEGFAIVSAAYDNRDPGAIKPEERDFLRLAQLYHADCAYFLEDYERAIILYDRAARRFAGHHSSMYALVQIVNAYSALGDVERARAAHRRALAALGQMGQPAFDAADALMDRQAWERWLENAPVRVGDALTQADGF